MATVKGIKVKKADFYSLRKDRTNIKSKCFITLFIFAGKSLKNYCLPTAISTNPSQKNTYIAFFLIAIHLYVSLGVWLLGQSGTDWWDHPSANGDVARIQIPASTPHVDWVVCCLFSPLFRDWGFSLGTPISTSPQNPTFPNSNSTRNGRRRTALWISYL